MNAEDVGRQPQEEDPAAERKAPDSEAARHGGGGIPSSPKGVGIGASTEPNTFEPEEDPGAADDNAKS